jgi:hypothetical protein
MRLPQFNATKSLYRSGRRYRRGRARESQGAVVVPAIPACANCDWILERCEINGWRPRAVCNACAVGWCYDEPPAPDPFPDPFDPLPRF